jgi:NADH-quinone oxidoreductase subunit F
MLGSGGFIVYDDTCIVRNTWNFACFYHHESCGQCSPCRRNRMVRKVLWRIVTSEEDIDLLWSIQSKIEETRFVH